MDSVFGVDIELRANKAALELYQEISRFPDWAQWSVPCDPNVPTDVVVARACQILMQNHPNEFVILWSKKNLTIYRKAEWEKIASKELRDSLAKWNLTLRPQRTEEGLPVPFEAAGGVQFGESAPSGPTILNSRGEDATTPKLTVVAEPIADVLPFPQTDKIDPTK